LRLKLSRRVGRFRLDLVFFWLLIVLAIFVAARAWLAEHPEHNPWAPLNLDDPPGWTTHYKLAALRKDPAKCHAVLERSGVPFEALPAVGKRECRREDRMILSRAPLAPAVPQTTCAVAAGFELWLRQGVQPAAEKLFGERVARIEHFGAYSCRRVYGREAGNWSEHSTGNALDIAAFVLADGERISVRTNWEGEGRKARFLHHVRDEACKVFGTVLSPDYNAAHADHLHLDQAARRFGAFCR
jgi:hypothetical protein